MMWESEYRLPECDVQAERRNFPGVQIEQVYTLADLMAGDTSGITETDSVTSGKNDGDYTRINKK